MDDAFVERIKGDRRIIEINKKCECSCGVIEKIIGNTKISKQRLSRKGVSTLSLKPPERLATFGQCSVMLIRSLPTLFAQVPGQSTESAQRDQIRINR